jgi:transglutaminase-like putative cysteine protease
LHCRTPILSYSLDVTPSEHFLSWQLDPSSNQQARVLFPNKTSEFAVDVNIVADLSPINPFDFLLDPEVEEYPFQYAPDVAKDLHPYLVADPP